jgi:hypothetical protein
MEPVTRWVGPPVRGRHDAFAPPPQLQPGETVLNVPVGRVPCPTPAARAVITALKRDFPAAFCALTIALPMLPDSPFDLWTSDSAIVVQRRRADVPGWMRDAYGSTQTAICAYGTGRVTLSTWRLWSPATRCSWLSQHAESHRVRVLTLLLACRRRGMRPPPPEIWRLMSESGLIDGACIGHGALPNGTIRRVREHW